MVRSPWRGRRLACGCALLRTATLLSILDATREAPRRRLRGGKRRGWGLLLWERRPRQPCSTGPPSVFGQLLWQRALMFFGARWEQENSARGRRVGWVLGSLRSVIRGRRWRDVAEPRRHTQQRHRRLKEASRMLGSPL